MPLIISLRRKSPALHCSLALYCLLAISVAGPAPAQSALGAVIANTGSLHAVAFGDFGRRGRPYQREVAAAIAKENGGNAFQLGLTLGDNFYECGVRSVHDPAWRDLWEAFYTPLKFPFYATLGNHDYGHGDGRCVASRTDTQAEVDYTGHSESWHMPARYYTFLAGPVQFFALDTELWSEAQKQWLAERLSAPPPAGITWRVVYGHHPIFTSGIHHADPYVKRLQRNLLPLLKDHRVDLYLAGHDHDLEHLRADGVELFVAGGGGEQVRNVNHRDPHSLAAASKHGFLDLTASAKTIEVRLVDIRLQPIESQPWVKTR